MNFEPEAANNFIEEIVARDLESGKHKKIVTRFPPDTCTSAMPKPFCWISASRKNTMASATSVLTIPTP